MRTSGLGFSAVLIAVGAILAWAVTYEAEGIDLNQVGVIVFIVGIALAAITLVATAAGSRTTVATDRESIVNGQPVVQRDRETIVEHNAQL